MRVAVIPKKCAGQARCRPGADCPSGHFQKRADLQIVVRRVHRKTRLALLATRPQRDILEELAESHRPCRFYRPSSTRWHRHTERSRAGKLSKEDANATKLKGSLHYLIGIGRLSAGVNNLGYLHHRSSIVKKLRRIEPLELFAEIFCHGSHPVHRRLRHARSERGQGAAR